MTFIRLMTSRTTPCPPPKIFDSPRKGFSAMKLGWSLVTLKTSPVCAMFASKRDQHHTDQQRHHRKTDTRHRADHQRADAVGTEIGDGTKREHFLQQNSRSALNSAAAERIEEHERADEQHRRREVRASGDVALLPRLHPAPRRRSFGFVAHVFSHFQTSKSHTRPLCGQKLVGGPEGCATGVLHTVRATFIDSLIASCKTFGVL